MNQKAAVEILETAKRCYAEGLMAGTSGNLSVRLDDKTFLITPGSLDYAVMTPGDMVAVQTGGATVSGTRKPSSEWRMHAEIYKALPRVNAVVHTHSPYATSFAVLGERIPVILCEMIPFIGGDIPVSAFAVPGTEAVGINAADSLKNRSACLMQNHGVLAAGESLYQAYINAAYAEDAAKIYHMAKCAGTPVVLTEEQQTRVRGG